MACMNFICQQRKKDMSIAGIEKNASTIMLNQNGVTNSSTIVLALHYAVNTRKNLLLNKKHGNE